MLLHTLIHTSTDYFVQYKVVEMISVHRYLRVFEDIRRFVVSGCLRALLNNWSWSDDAALTMIEI